MVEQLGTPGRRHVLSVGSFEITPFWTDFFFFALRTALLQALAVGWPYISTGTRLAVIFL